MCLLIDLESTDLDCLRSFVRVIASPQCPYTCDEFTIVTWFCEIVISTIIETFYDILLCSTRSKHDDGSGFSFAAQLAADIYPIHTRKLDVKDDHIKIPIHGFHIPLFAIGPEKTPDILIGEVAGDSLGKRDVIFDKERIQGDEGKGIRVV